MPADIMNARGTTACWSWPKDTNPPRNLAIMAHQVRAVTRAEIKGPVEQI